MEVEKVDIKGLIPCYNVYRAHGGSLDALEYDKVAYKAMKHIGYVTLDRAYPYVSEDEDILYCHAELCDQFAAINALQSRVNAAKDITSESIGPHSVHYAGAADALQQAQNALYTICSHYLRPYTYRRVPIV